MNRIRNILRILCKVTVYAYHLKDGLFSVFPAVHEPRVLLLQFLCTEFANPFLYHTTVNSIDISL